ncbi:MAG: EAL domain-containing protein [Ideonella sp.]|jgi:diguanylate cyclase (GGDEF)-like protein|nr:EAL domain-containing protein [Ideonella sp.]
MLASRHILPESSSLPPYPHAPKAAPADSTGPLLLPAASIVEQAMAHARRAIALSLAGAAILLLAVLAERWWFDAAQREATQRHAAALRVAGELRLADERLTAAAQLAVLTGQSGWVDRFDRDLPRFEALLAQARALAPGEALERFGLATRSAGEELEDMRLAAFEAVVVGSPEVARSIFEGDRYRAKTALLRQAIDDFAQSTVAAAQRELERVRSRNALIASTLLLAALVLAGGLARRLAGSRARLQQAEARVQALAATDLLTGLPNRAALHDAMAKALAQATRAGGRLAVLLIDLDRFKPINDRYGHGAGDQVLRTVGERLRMLLRQGDTRARYGGDEFVILVDESEDASATRHLAERIADSLRQPIDLGPASVNIGATVGIARFPEDAREADDLLRKADSALYRAKGDARGGICFYDPGLDEQVAERAALEQSIRDGIPRGEFIPYLQPVVELTSDRIVGVEVLARWQHPKRGLLPPSAFIGVAEATGLIGPLTLALLDRACRDTAALPPEWRLSINLAPDQMLDDSLAPQLAAILGEHGVAASRLDLELTETALVRDTGAARKVTAALKAAGFTVTLDDFGTGYSSLAYLAELAFDRIKIDRSFIRTLRDRPESAKVVEAIIGLSRSLGVSTVAEGIEDACDAARLRAMGCPLGQGYHFGRPAPAGELLARLHGRQPVDAT